MVGPETLAACPGDVVAELLALRALVATRPDTSCTSLPERKRWDAACAEIVPLDPALRAAVSPHYKALATGKMPYWHR